MDSGLAPRGAPRNDGRALLVDSHFFFPKPGKPPRPGKFGLPLKPVSPGKFGRPERKPGGKSLGNDGMAVGNPPGIFSAIALSCSGEGPPKPMACAMPAIGPRLPEPIIFIMSAMFRCILRSL